MISRHPLSAAWGDMPEDEFIALVEDVRENGQRDPIVLFEGMVLDGWHRHRACTSLSIDCASIELAADQDPVALVISRNACRRSLNAGQKALAIVQCKSWAPRGRPGPKSAPGADFSTTTEMADGVGVSTRTIEQAKEVLATATPEVQAAVRQGKVSLKRAVDVARKPRAEQRKALEETGTPRPKKRAKALVAAKAESARLAESVHNGFDPIRELEAAHQQIAGLQALVDAAEADDLKAEVLKWRRACEVAERALAEKMDAAAHYQRSLNSKSDWIGRLCDIVGERDLRKVLSTIESMFQDTKGAA